METRHPRRPGGGDRFNGATVMTLLVAGRSASSATSTHGHAAIENHHQHHRAKGTRGDRPHHHPRRPADQLRLRCPPESGQLDVLTSWPALPGSALTSARPPRLAALTVVADDDSLVTRPRIHVHVAAEQLFGVAVPR
jgi:hypothetical protein